MAAPFEVMRGSDQAFSHPLTEVLETMNDQAVRIRCRCATTLAPRGVGAALALVSAAACGGEGVEGDRTGLGPPQATLEHEFAVIQTVRELPDGRVLVADPLGQTLLVADMDAGTTVSVGRVGEGPDEYRQPDAVWPLPGDRSLLVDLGNGRLTEMGADLSFGDTRPYMLGSFQMGSPIMLAIPRGVDEDGGIYFQGFGMSAGGEVADSSQVLRYDLETEAVDTVASVKLTDRTRRASGGAGNRNVSISPIPLSPADAWGVAADGRVVVARSVAGSGEFWVEWFAPDGEVTRGPAYAYQPVDIGRAEMEEWRAAQAETGGGMTIRVNGVNGNMDVRAGRGGAPGNDDLDGYQWPDSKPAFFGRVPVDPTGRAWVRRHAAAGDAPAYDLFDGSGTRAATIELPMGRRVVAFGEGVAYVVRMDEFDLQYLERYGMP